MTEHWNWRKAGADIVGVQVYATEERGEQRHFYRVQIRRAGAIEPEFYAQRSDQSPFRSRDEALAAGWKEGERQYFGLPKG